MDVKTVCLGLLYDREACGYDLKKEFESLFKHFYPAGCGSIYPALASLADEGHLSCREVAQQGKPDRKVYRITETGRQCFSAALLQAEPQHKLRSEFLAMIYFADLMNKGRVRGLLDERLREFRDTISHITEIQHKRGDELSPGERFVAGFGAALARTAADYIETNRAMLMHDADNRRKPLTLAGDNHKDAVGGRA